MDFQQRAVRRTFGAFWMTLYGSAASSVFWWAVRPALAQFAIWILVTGGLGLAVVLESLRLRSRSGPVTRRRPFDSRLARNIGAVIVVYAAVEGIAAVFLHLLQHDVLIFPVAVGIAGVHFFAFARVLDTWQYYITGALDCLAALGSIVLLAPTSRVGVMPSWVFFPLLGGGIALFVTAGLMLLESRIILRASGAHTTE